MEMKLDLNLNWISSWIRNTLRVREPQGFPTHNQRKLQAKRKSIHKQSQKDLICSDEHHQQTQSKKKGNKSVEESIYRSIDLLKYFVKLPTKNYYPNVMKILGIDRELQTSAEHRSKSLPQIRYQYTTQNGEVMRISSQAKLWSVFWSASGLHSQGAKPLLLSPWRHHLLLLWNSVLCVVVVVVMMVILLDLVLCSYDRREHGFCGLGRRGKNGRGF